MSGKARGGYVLLAKRILDSGLMAKPPLHLKLWVWMLTRAEWREGAKLKRGQLHTSIAEMREAMSYMVGYRKVKPTVKEIRSAYEGFAKGTMIDTTKGTRGMVITIRNYDKYQNPKNYEGHDEGHDEKYTKGREGAQDRERILKNRNKKKYKKAKINFNFETGRWENITEQDVQLWMEAYPAVNLKLQITQAAAWLVANPSKKKSDYKRFLNNWLKRAQDRGGDLPSKQGNNGPQPKSYYQAVDAERRTIAMRLLQEWDNAEHPDSEKRTPQGQHRSPLPQGGE